ncbi:hypothetical protein C8R46DRAFT_1343888 [Mycena filopes]|nr:hypothetical protein C8R46DRAFT_1343888 [Mycena filopes]
MGPGIINRTLLSSLSTCAAGISLTAPTADVVLSTFIDCAWSATPPDPVSFRLAVQYGVNFTQIALASIVHRGNDTSGTVENVATVNILGGFCGPIRRSITALGVVRNVPGRPKLGFLPILVVNHPLIDDDGPQQPIEDQMIIGVSLGTCTALGLLALAYCFLLWRRKARRGVPVGPPLRHVSPFLDRAPMLAATSDNSSSAAAAATSTRGAEGLNPRHEAPPPYVSGL